ncbi:Glycosyltransferase Family 1 protein [Trametes cinnabarina]|uniref:Glycosyltransferase Family 1 protein n=1 Tax=Pycnoporus cinnabarinus TaxID=5643 RepID=A0A060S4Z1_PYCCI|nr:Glycosyltransferase Family 1 protein [Trametes cinnabarina]
MCALCARVAKAGPILVTLLTPASLYDAAKAELARNFQSGEDESLSRVRIVAVERGKVVLMETIPSSFISAYRDIFSGKELVCARTGQGVPPVLPPKAVIIECFAYEAVRDIRDISGTTAKVYAWVPSMISVLFYYTFGPEGVDGGVSLHAKAEAEALRSGREYAEVAHELVMRGRGDVVRVPGLPPMYDYEYHPQHIPLFDAINCAYLARTYDTILLSDGALVATPEAYERQAVAAVRKWFGELQKPVYVIGPLQPSGTQAAIVYEKAQAPQIREIETFLDNTLRNFGERSLLYISFGSMFWPVVAPENLWTFLDVVMDLKIPFLLSHVSPFAIIPGTVKDKYVAETSADQPLNAVHLVENFGAAYELLEVRTGQGLKPIYRTGKTPAGTVEAVEAEARDVLTRAFGEDGVRKRAHLIQLRKEVLQAWSDPVDGDSGGSSRKDLMTFVKSLV